MELGLGCRDARISSEGIASETEAGQDLDGGVDIMLGAKGLVELELVSGGSNGARSPRSTRARCRT